MYVHMCTCIYALIGICADRTLCGVMHSPTLGCDRSDALNRLHSQRRKAANIASNLLRVAQNSDIDKTTKMTIGKNACIVICQCINVVSTDLPCA